MGYSCSSLAGHAETCMMNLMQGKYGDCNGSGNSWGTPTDFKFFEIGREQADGAITGTVYDHTGRVVGPVRIEPSGKVTRYPGSDAAFRTCAEIGAHARFEKDYGQAELQNQLRIAAAKAA